MGARPGRHHGLRAAAEGTGEAFLDDDIAIKAVLGQIGDAKAARVDVADNRILALQQLRAGLQLIHEIVSILDRSLDSFLLRHLAHPSRKRGPPGCQSNSDAAGVQTFPALRLTSSTPAHQSTV
jgi:hypothetical protein